MSSSLARPHPGRVICLCAHCYPGKEVALRTRQTHYRVNGPPQIPKDLLRSLQDPLDFGTNGNFDLDTVMEYYSPSDEEMYEYSGVDLVVILTFRRRKL